MIKTFMVGEGAVDREGGSSKRCLKCGGGVGVINPKSTGLFPPGVALGGVFHSPHVRSDPDILES